MRHNIPQAQDCFERVIALKPDDIESHVLLGVCSVLAHEEQGAAERFRRALQVDPSCRIASEYLSWLASNS